MPETAIYHCKLIHWHFDYDLGSHVHLCFQDRKSWSCWDIYHNGLCFCKIVNCLCFILQIHWTDSCPWGEDGSFIECAAKSLQSCPTLCNPIDGSPPGSPVPGILQARTLKWVAISFSNAWKWKMKVKSLSCIRLLATPWTAAYQAPPSIGFSRQENWSGVPLPSPIHRM